MGTLPLKVPTEIVSSSKIDVMAGKVPTVEAIADFENVPTTPTAPTQAEAFTRKCRRDACELLRGLWEL